MRSCDVAVVGASFAGLACARAIAARGLSTVVLERRSEPGAAPRTTGLLVKEAADEWEVPRRLVRRIPKVRLYAPSLRSFDLESPGYHFLATDTAGLLRWFAAGAGECGAEIRCGVDVRGLERIGGRHRLPEAGLDARFLVGADGARSRVARSLGLGANRLFLSGAEVELEGARGIDPDFLHCFLDPALAPGYIAWAFEGVGRAQIGLAALAPAPPRLDLLLHKLSKVFDLSRARVAGHRGGRIPVGGRVRPFHAPGALLVGDAAGWVSPLTAGGIQTALHFGRLAGRLVADHLAGAGPEPARRLDRELPRFFWKGLLRTAYHRLARRRILDLAFESPLFTAAARSIFFHNRGLFSAAAWRDIARAALLHRPQPVR